MTKSLIPIAFIASSIALPLLASDHAADVVTSRQEDMKAMSASAKTLNEFFLGRRKYDSAAFRAAADAIRQRAGTRLTAHFTDVFAAEGSDAGPEIQSDKAKFDALANQLEVYAAQVSRAAQNGDELPQSMRMRPQEVLSGGPFAKRTGIAADPSNYSSEHAFHMMLQTCTSCHAKYRIRRD